ncbi:MAG: protein-methionine-sulfoxide reductase heme-binding subunit MsrQ [Pseudomonadota bacterium]
MATPGAKPVSKQEFIPWLDRSGRFSTLRAVSFAIAVMPGVWIAYALIADRLTAEPLKEATHLTGTWTLYFLLASLAATPLRRLLAWPKIIGIRRMLGLTAFGYAAAHLTLYIVDQGGDMLKVAGEITSRFYLTVGFVAVFGLSILAATSFDAAIRRLGRNWKRLHSVVYLLTALGLLHFFLHSKVDVSKPVLLTGIFIGLMLYRLPIRLGALPKILIVTVLTGLATAMVEFAWYALMTGVPAERVLRSNLDFSHQIRPIWWVMVICAAPFLLSLLKQLHWPSKLRPRHLTRSA